MQLFAHKLATNPSAEIVNSLIVVIGLDKPNLQRRALRVLKSLIAAGNNIAMPNEILMKIKNSGDKVIADILTDFYR